MFKWKRGVDLISSFMATTVTTPNRLLHSPTIDLSGAAASSTTLTVFRRVVYCSSPKNTGIVLIVRGCHDSSHKITANDQKAWARAIPQSLSDLEIGMNGEGSSDSRLLNARGGSCTPLGFSENSLANKIVVAVDVDEVLGNFVSAINKFVADRYSSNHSVSEYHVYEFFKIWNCSRSEADIRVHEFFKTSYFKKGIYPLPGAQKALHKLSRYYNLSVVTSRQNAIKDHTIEWIERHYPGLFQEIHFGNHFALDGESRPKSEICRSLGAKVLIDDNPRYAMECAEIGMKVLLFDYENSYPWSKTELANKHPLVTRVENWKQVEQNLLSWITTTSTSPSTSSP